MRNTYNWIRTIMWVMGRLLIESPIVALVVMLIVSAIFGVGYLVGAR